MPTFADLIDQLPESPAYGPYDGVIVSTQHMDRLRETASPEQTTWSGLKVVSNPCIPEGFAVITNEGRPVGIIDFAAGVTTVAKAKPR